MSDLASHTMSNTPMYSFVNKKVWARVLCVHDGDTMTCAIEAFPQCFFRYNVRLDGIDTKEITSHDPATKERAIAARNALLNHVTGETVAANDATYSRNDIINKLANDVHLVFLHCDKMDKYGRILATVYKAPDDQESINTILIKKGLAVKYDGGKKTDW